MSIEKDKNLINPDEELDEDIEISDEIDFELIITPTTFTEKINPYLLKSFYKTTPIIKKKGILEFSISLLSPITEPHIFNYFQLNNKKSNEDFFNYIFNNFQKITPTEIELINTHFHSEDYIELFFNYIISSSLEINKNTFNSFIKNSKFDNKFLNIFEQHLMTKYAINNMSSLKETELDFLFSKINVHLSKDLFFEQSVKNKEPIWNEKFWNFFMHDDPFVKKYLKHSSNNQWSKHLRFFFNHYYDMAENYFNNLTYPSSDSDKFFEQNFILHKPSSAHLSHLNVEELHYVFSKVYTQVIEEKTNHKNLESNNFELLNFEKLGIGKYFLLDYMGKEHPSQLKRLLEINFKRNTSLIEDFASEFSEKLNPNFQDSFNNNVILPNLYLFLENKEVTRKIFKHNSPFVSFLASYLHLIPDKEHNYLIYQSMKKSFDFAKFNLQFNSQEMQNNLNVYNLNSLQKFEPHFDLSLEILISSYSSYDFREEATEVFKKVLLNKKLESELANSNHNVKKIKTKI